MKAWDLPISRNPLRTRDDLAGSLDQILEPLLPRFVRGDSGLAIGATAAHYDDAAALLEGMSRLLWGLAPCAAGSLVGRPAGEGRGAAPDGGERASDAATRRAVRGLRSGTDPSGPHYWGVGGDRDQRYVEMAAIALSLLIAPETFWRPLPAQDRANLAAWLGTINGVELPPTNWEFFRVLVNLALKRLGERHDGDRLRAGLAAIDALYRDEGWYIDETNYDLYNPFAFHFYGLVYAKIEGGEDPARAARFRERARLFARQYLPWFAGDGSCVPFGRSLCYRFAAASFFSACAFAGEEVLPWGALKGLVLRNFRQWFAKPVFDHEGVLTIGYGYPNLVMAEQYNSPGSPYWALKAYLVLALGEGHPFWAAREESLPALPPVTRNAPPHILACRHGSGPSEHVYLLNAGQYPCWESVNAAAKYAKFAYSASFGFCVSHGGYGLSQAGCDSALLLSEGDGYWRERRRSEGRGSGEGHVVSVWRPWPDVAIRSWVLPFGPWQVRVHEIESARELECVEGGFSLPDDDGLSGRRAPRRIEGPGSLMAAFPWAYGGVMDLLGGREAELHKPEPNLNVLHPRVLVPVLRGRARAGRSLLACAAAAGPLDPADAGGGEAEAVWAAPPRLSVDASGSRIDIEGYGRRAVLDLAAGTAETSRNAGATGTGTVGGGEAR